VTTFADSVAALLGPRIPELARHWRSRAHAATPRAAGDASPEAADALAERVVRSVVACLDRDARCQGEVMRVAWDAGVAAHGAGLSVHHVLRDADLLLAVLLTAVEDAARWGALVAGTTADAFEVARRLQRAVGLHAQAATTSYLHALVTALRASWRLLRHDLRNPLGTIQSALSLMEDETLPESARTGPRIRAMLSRNAVTLDGLIAARLDDRLAEALVAAPQEVSLRDVALAVRRSLRESVRQAGCEILVDDDLPAARVDEAALELTLGTLLLAAVARARPGDVLRVRTAARDAARGVTLCVVREPGEGGDVEGWDPDDLALSIELAGEYGGRIAARARAVEFELPLLPEADDDSAARAAAPAARRASSGRQQRDDVARAD
jgi:signal transduction histidine kinase